MKIAMSGGEKGTYRNILVENSAPHIALNITQFSIPKRKELNLKELLNNAEVYVYTSDEDEDVHRFDQFVRDYIDQIDMVIGRPDYDGTWVGEKYVPLWNDPKDEERLAHLCQKYGRVAISDRALNPRTLMRIKQLQQRWGCTLVALTSKVDMIEAVHWDTVIVSSWTSVVRYGETQVWDGHGLRRYPAQKKESSRKKHRADIVRLGIDFDSVIEDDVKEVAKLAVLSWQEWEKSTFGTSTFAAYHPSEGEDEYEFEGPTKGEVVDISHLMPPKTNTSNGQSLIDIQRRSQSGENGKELLPVIGMETVISVGTHDTTDGEDSFEINPQREQVVRYKTSGIRSCDNCYLAPRCPRFEEHTECAFELPVELKTKEQLRSVLRAMLEMQTSRILFASFAEQLEGQGMDPVLSKEMDRLFELTQRFKDIEDTRDLVRFEVEARAGAGVLSRIFGDRAAEKVNQLSDPLPQAALDQLILDAQVIDPPE
jgi:hypothetical protein